MNYSALNRFPGGDWDWEVPDRDEYLTLAYIDGRNAARDGKSRNDITHRYAVDSLAAVNWETGYDDWTAESQTKK